MLSNAGVKPFGVAVRYDGGGVKIAHFFVTYFLNGPLAIFVNFNSLFVLCFVSIYCIVYGPTNLKWLAMGKVNFCK